MHTDFRGQGCDDSRGRRLHTRVGPAVHWFLFKCDVLADGVARVPPCTRDRGLEQKGWMVRSVGGAGFPKFHSALASDVVV